MNWKYLILSAVALIGFNAVYAQDATPSASASASAGTEQKWGEGRHHHFGFFFKQLNLTDAQKAQLKQYFSDNKQAFKSNMLNFLKAKQAVNNAMEKNPIDEATIRSLSANVASARTELAVQHAKFHAFLVSILTDQQKQTLTSLEQKRDSNLQEHIDHLSQSTS
jgi:Spy/CpxP family protein refolding chaperone